MFVKALARGLSLRVALVSFRGGGSAVLVTFQSETLAARLSALGLNDLVADLVDEGCKASVISFNLRCAIAGVDIFSGVSGYYEERYGIEIVDDLQAFDARFVPVLSGNAEFAAALEQGDLPGVVLKESRFLIAAVLYEMDGQRDAALRVLEKARVEYAAEPQNPDWMHMRQERLERGAQILAAVL